MSPIRLVLVRVLACLIVAPLTGGNTALACVEGCESLDNTDGPKVVVGNITHETPSGQTESLTEKHDVRMLIELISMLRDLCPGADPTPVVCANRSPSNDGSDFEPDFVKALNRRDVLLEVWGEIKETTVADGTAYSAEVCMMLIPVRHYESGTSLVDHHLLIYQSSGQGSVEDAFIEIMLHTEFQVYTLVAYGMKAFKNEEFDTAKKYLAKARILWEGALAAETLAMTATRPEEVLAYIKSLEQQCVSAAGGDVAAVSELLEGGG